MLRQLWKRWREKRDRKAGFRLFSKYIGEQVVEQMESQAGGAAIESSTQERQVDFIFLTVHRDEAEEINARLEVIVPLAERHGAVTNALHPVVTFVFGMIEPLVTGKRERLVEELRRVAPWCSLVHGTARAMVGLFGGRSRCEFTFWWAGKGAAIKHLQALAPGDMVAWPVPAADATPP